MSAALPPPRLPDFDLSMMFKDGTGKGKVGAAWQEADGTISVVLNHMVQLPRQEGYLVLKLFKRGRGERAAVAQPKQTGPPEDELDYMDGLKKGVNI